MRDFITSLSVPLKVGIIVFITITLLAGCASNKKANLKTAEAAKVISDVIISEDAKATTIRVKGNQPLTYTARKQDYPLGVHFYFPKTTLDNMKAVHYPPENDTVSFIRVKETEEKGKESWVFIALKKDIPYDTAADTDGLLIYFSKSARQTADVPSQTDQSDTKKAASKPVKPAGAPAKRITTVSATPLRNNVAINIKADGTIKNYKSFTIDNPPRIVVDMLNIKSPYQGEQRIAVKSQWVNSVRHFGHPAKVRLVVDTQKVYLSKFSATPIDNGLLIYVGELPKTAGDETTKSMIVQAPKPVALKVKNNPGVGTSLSTPEKATAANPVKNEEESKPVVAQATTTVQTQSKENPGAESPQPASEKAPAVKSFRNDQPAWLNRIDFSSEEAGKSAIIIGTTRPVNYEITKVGSKRVRLKLLDTNLPEYRKRALITTRFQSAVDRITPTQQPKTQDTLVDIDLREAVPYFVKQTDNIIKVNFSPSTIPPKPYEDAKPPAWKRTASESAEDAKLQASKAGSSQFMPVAQPMAATSSGSLAQRIARAQTTKRYTGEKIALDFYDTDIKNVFRILREISGKNFAIDKNVTGKVTLTLERPVPWDQVLDLVLKMNQLGMTMEGDIIRIATLNTLAQEEKLRQAKLKAEQQALQQQKALEPLITEYIAVNYSDAKNEVLPHIKPILTEGRGKASVDTRNNQLILTDTAEKILQIREVVMKIDQVTPQVIIEARIVEANTAFTRDLGFDWGEITAGPFNSGNTETTLRGLASNLPATIPSSVVGFDFVKLSGTPFSIIDAKLVVSETEGKTNIISAPKVVTLDNKKAAIKQGLEVPYLERDSSGNATVRFKDVDLLLEVTPNITPDDRIVMKIFVTKNDVVDPTADQPALSTNEAKTELLVDDGDTIVIGGIVKSSITYGEQGIPGLRKLGVLGWLFKSQSKTDSKNELLIFITPRIVQLEQKANV